MRRPHLSTLGLVLTLLAPAAPATGQIADRAVLIGALDSVARAHVAHDDVAGVSVAIVRGADTLLLRGYGFVDLEWDVPTPTDASASYEIGSVTKQFTAAALLQLVEEGKVDLDADVTSYLPDFDTQGHAVPVRRLLDHTSGIKGYTEMPVFGEIMGRDLPRDSLVSLIEAEPFQFEPGTGQIYNNSAYFLLGLIIEHVTGMPYEDVIAERLFEPLGMASSYYCSESAIRDGRAHGYDAHPDGLRRKAYLDHTWPFAGGSLCSTAGDLVRWNHALHGDAVLTEASYRAMITPMPLVDGTIVRYAMGLGIGERNGHRMIAHGGGINGFLSDAAYFPDDDLTIVVLQNTAGPRGPGALTGAFEDLLLGSVPEPVSVPYTGDLDRLTGTYAGPVRSGHLHLTVSREGDALTFRPGGQEEAQRPIHIGDGVWRLGGLDYVFDTAGDRVLSLRVSGGSAQSTLVRVN